MAMHADLTPHRMGYLVLHACEAVMHTGPRSLMGWNKISVHDRLAKCLHASNGSRTQCSSYLQSLKYILGSAHGIAIEMR